MSSMMNGMTGDMGLWMIMGGVILLALVFVVLKLLK